MRFDLLQYPILFHDPLVVSEESAWVTHIPFAFLLMQIMRPRTLVELGTHHGDSYLAFCQAIKFLNLPTQCHAVDSWQGDVFTGEYGPQVLQDLRARHDQIYGSFSTLMRCTFDEAAPKFEAGQIDLLHIDGLHTYEGVKKDFETWKPKLSDRAVVLFHDTNWRVLDFGVWRLWDEISRQYPSFQFLHGFGLGVAAIGNNVPADVLSFIQSASAEGDLFQTFFRVLGERINNHRVALVMINTLAQEEGIARQWLNLVGESADPMDWGNAFPNPAPPARNMLKLFHHITQTDVNIRQQFLNLMKNHQDLQKRLNELEQEKSKHP